MYPIYRKVIRILRQKCPPTLPVHVKRVKLYDKDGYCSKVNKKFYIRINKNLPESSAIDALLHEWSHALAWKDCYDELDQKEFEKRIHDTNWGIAYATVYRIFDTHFTQ